MSTLWLVSEDAPLVRSLSHHLRELGDVYTGAPELGAFADAPAPDLVVTGIPAEHDATDPRVQLERLLGFLRRVPAPRREPAPVLYVEARGRRPSSVLVRSLVDDRRTAALAWPLDVSRLLDSAEQLLEAPDPPVSLRERARREWVGRRVELLYAGIDLPALRAAIDPRNAALPVLLAGEPGTHRGLLARYIHNLAEPARDELVVVQADALEPSRVESTLLEAAAGRRVTLYLERLDAASRPVQAALGQLLAESGALAIEPIRWIASTSDLRSLHPTLGQPGWLHVAVPAVRERDDFDALVRALAAPERVEPEALEALRSHLWPDNLRELEWELEETIRRGPQPFTATPRAEGAVVPAVEPIDVPTAYDAPHDEKADPTDPLAQEDLLDETLSLASTLEPQEVGEVPTLETPPPDEPAFDELLSLLGEQLRQPLLAVRTCAGLLEQNPGDEEVRRELASVASDDLVRVEHWIERFAQFARFGAPKPEPVSLSAIANAELERLAPRIRERSLVVLRELDDDGPPALADPEQLRFALGALFDCAIRLMPDGGDLYVGSLYQAREGGEARHRLLLRFYSPEDVLVGQDELPGAREPLEVIWARILLARGNAEFAVDTSGSQDNVALVALPVV